MRMTIVNRLVVTVGLSAATLAGLNVPIYAHPQRDQRRQDDQQRQEERRRLDEQRQLEDQQRLEDQRLRDEQRLREDRDLAERDRPQRGPDGRADRGRLTQRAQQERIRRQEQRSEEYRQQLDQQERISDQRSADLQRQNRRAQYSSQQQYMARMRQQQLRIQRQDRYNYDRDPYFFAPATYRYSRGGRSYETNQYGVDLLRQAVNYGYEEGRRAGMADRQDRWRSNYRSSFAYQDANYGYSGFYVDRDDYNFYFREGFRRGYEDGHGNRQRFGRISNGKVAIIGAVLAGVLAFEAIR